MADENPDEIDEKKETAKDKVNGEAVETITELEMSEGKGVVFDQVIEDELRKSFLDYAMSVIVSRALPDVRDGLKPVHRRILFAMNELGLQYSKKFRKSATVVGEVLGKYHPHGDAAVYDSMVRMAQNWSLRYPLVFGQGNFGSIDGDSPAAMRYTEAKMAKISDDILADIKKETIDWTDNFDATLKEPSVLPSKVPNLLINGSTGIAVGMATNIPPHNIKEICDVIIAQIDNPEITVQDLIKILPGPDFPTGGTICGRTGIYQAYTSGYGKIKLNGKTHFEKVGKKDAIIIDEIPYTVNKAMLVEEIANLVKDERVEGISDLRDESDRTGMRVVIELKKDASQEVLLNNIMKHSRLSITFGYINLVLVNNQPKVLDLKHTIQYFIEHRVDVITRRTKFDLLKAQERAHILEGIMIALKNIDAVVALLKQSKTVEIAKTQLMANYALDEKQSIAILDMKLQKITSLETDSIKKEFDELMELIKRLNEILASKQIVLNMIKEDTKEIKEKYGDNRKTNIEDSQDQIEDEDLITPEDVVVTVSHAGYVKRIPVETYREQNRGGKGVTGTTMREEDFVEHIFISNTHDFLLVFTTTGKVHWLKVHQIPEGTRQAKGKPMINLVRLEEGEKIAATFTVKNFESGNLLFATKKGIVKKTELVEYSRPRAGGIIALSLDADDELIKVVRTTGKDNIILATKKGNAVLFNEEDVRCMGRSATGVIGIRLDNDDDLVGSEIAKENYSVLTITENGFGKRSPLDEYRLIRRGGSGVINIKCSERNGNVVGIKCVKDNDSIMIISRDGTVIRTSVDTISVIGRNTQGVIIMRLDKNDKVVAIAAIEEETKS
ncbi:MAG: DNA gyrase subunit A [Candidatus Woesearchaeota archaeon]|jgi:DNA gyrase subunit A